MKRTEILPDGYKEIYKVDLQKNKKTAILINVMALVIAAAMAVPMAFIFPISELFDMSEGILLYAARLLALAVSMIAYIVLHELVHGAAMKLFGTKKVNFGFTGLYAYAGSSDYYGKWSYIVIALAPVVLLGIILAVINLIVPSAWFWVVYIIQISNISGACGDYFVTAKFIKMPSDILVCDSGVGMTVYSKQ